MSRHPFPTDLISRGIFYLLVLILIGLILWPEKDDPRPLCQEVHVEANAVAIVAPPAEGELCQEIHITAPSPTPSPGATLPPSPSPTPESGGLPPQ